MPYRPTARTLARQADNRRRLLDEARTIVTDEGFGAVSIAAVAAAADLATGSVYRYFPSKQDLLAEVFRLAAQREVDVMREVARGPGPALDRLRHALETFSDRALRSGRLAWALLAEPVDPAVDEERLVFRRAYAEILAAVVRDGIAGGELPEQDIGITAACVVGAIGEALVAPLAHEDGPPAGRRVARAAIEFCLRAVATPPSRGS
jgi:AcrR family transcriptional regulator